VVMAKFVYSWSRQEKEQWLKDSCFVFWCSHVGHSIISMYAYQVQSIAPNTGPSSFNSTLGFACKYHLPSTMSLMPIINNLIFHLNVIHNHHIDLYAYMYIADVRGKKWFDYNL